MSSFSASGARRRVPHASSRLFRIVIAISTLGFVHAHASAPRAAHRPAEVAQAVAGSGSGDRPVLRGTVIDVVDGDSLAVRLQSGPIEVRLHAADAPEHDQPGGRAASRALRQRLPRGTEVVLEPVEQDQYDRLVAVVEQDGSNVNAWLVQQGHAWAYRQYTADPRYCRWEDAARAARRGLWSSPPESWVAPWEWRRRARDPDYRPADRSRVALADCLASLHRSKNKASAARAPR